MLIESSISYEPIKLPFVFRGANIELLLRPLDVDALAQIRDRARSFHWAANPTTGKQELGSIVTDENLDLALFDHVIAGFFGVGSAKDKPWPQDAKHKSKLVYLKPGPEDKEPLWKTVLAAARDLAAQRLAELEAERKNS